MRYTMPQDERTFCHPWIGIFYRQVFTGLYLFCRKETIVFNGNIRQWSLYFGFSEENQESNVSKWTVHRSFDCKSSNFLYGLEFYFSYQKVCKFKAYHKLLVDKIQRLGGTVSDCFNENTTHLLFPRGVDYHFGLHSFQSTAQRKSLPWVYWLVSCLYYRKTQFEVK